MSRDPYDLPVKYLVEDMRNEMIAVRGESQKTSSSLKDMTVFLKRLADQLAPLKESFGAMEVFMSLKPLTKSLQESKFMKALKNFGNLLKGIIKASVKGWALQQLMTLLEPFLGILELFTPVVEVLAGIFMEALMPIMQEIIPVVMWLIGILQENKSVIISLVQLALMPLMTLFHDPGNAARTGKG